jgi:hypothetical protein
VRTRPSTSVTRRGFELAIWLDRLSKACGRRLPHEVPGHVRLVFGSGADLVETTLTVFELGEIDWIKMPAGPIATGPLELILPGGVRHVGSKMVRIVDPAFPAPELGERYLLFLTPGMGGYVPAAHGPQSAFVVLGGQLRAVGQSELSKQLAAVGRAALLAELRKRVP